MTRGRALKTIKAAAIILAVIGCSVGLSLRPQAAKAVSATDFQPGHIIDDGVFYNTGSFPNAQSVQDFITSHTPTCDTWGTQPSGYGNMTRAQYAQSIGWPGPPYVCLQNYYENPSTGATSFENGGGAFSGGESAGQIIYDAAQEYGINPQVLLVILKKESPGPLFSDDWPLKSQYRYAMGYACPDSGPNYSASCVSSHAGFYNQVNLAAWQLRQYATNIGSYNYQPGQTDYIQYSPDPNCGGQNVYIDNIATASLYIYTPYVPNQASLQAYPGTATCGSYGNRNFFMFFNEWFGSTYGSVNVTSPLTISSGLSQGLFTNHTITARFTLRNNSGQRQDIGTIAIATRNQAGANYDFGSQHIVLDPWQTYTYQATTSLAQEGQYSFSIADYQAGTGWSTTFPSSLNAAYPRAVNNAVVENMPTVTTAPAFDNTVLHVGQSTTARMTITNNSATYPVNLGYFGLAMTSPTGQNADLPFDTVTSLAPGASYSYYKTFIPTEVGTYNARVSSTGDGGQTWSETLYPEAVSPANNRVSVTVKDNPTLTQGMSITQNGPYAGDTVTGTFSIKNFSDSTVTINKKLCYIMRGPGGSNNDLGCLDIGTVASGQTLTYTSTETLPTAGQYRGYFSMYDGMAWHDNWTFPGETGAEPTSVSFTVKDNPTIVQGLTLSTTTPRQGDTVTGSFQVKNNSLQSVAINKSLCYIMRGPAGQNYDFGCLPMTTIAAGQTLTFSASRTLNDAGQYNGYFSMYDGTWHDNWTFALATGTESTSTQFTARSTPTLTQGLTIDNQSPAVGSSVTGTFKVKNNSGSAVTVNKNLCYIVRGPGGSNNDLGCLNIGTIAAGQELTFTGSRVITVAGQYNGYFSMYDGTWHDNWTFAGETGTEPTKVTFTAS